MPRAEDVGQQGALPLRHAKVLLDANPSSCHNTSLVGSFVHEGNNNERRWVSVFRWRQQNRILMLSEASVNLADAIQVGKLRGHLKNVRLLP